MTYNFDPEKWLENERLRVEMQRRNGEIAADAADKVLQDLERRYEEMLARLDGTFPVAGRSDPK